MNDILTEAERKRIRKAIDEAEQRTAGEIVPYIVPQSDDYEIARWRGAVFTGLLGLLAVLLVNQFYDGWGLSWMYESWGMALVILGAGVVGGGLTAFTPPLIRFLASEECTERVHNRAVQAFVEEEVFDTRDRTGVLLFVSLLEHRIEVLGDSGINSVVDPDDWVNIVDRIRRGIRNDRLADGLVDAVERCGALLDRKGVDIRPDDDNELSDSIRFSRD